jgi:predicted ArsR family transcriptional regulator
MCELYSVRLKKMHHRDGPETERTAARKVAPRVVGRRLEALGVLARLGKASGSDIASTAGLSILSIRPRLTELQDMELIVDTTGRKQNEYGNPEIIWEVTEKGKQYVD